MHEENTITVAKVESTPLTKIKNLSLTIMFLMISLGQWNDTKDVVISLYEEVISRFTNQVEYNYLEKLRIGFTKQYTEELLGSPQVIKPSKVKEGLQYYYYNSDKFLLITFMNNDRLQGFSVISKNKHFLAPIVYIKKQLNSLPLSDYLPSQGSFVTDAGNIEYFAETYELSHSLMFYNMSLGHINYSLLDSTYSKDIISVNDVLNMGDDFDFSTLSFSTPLIPNFYAITELPSEVIFEALLSNYEMSNLFANTN